MYMFFINGVQLPVAPSKIDIKTKSNNKQINLINEGDVSVLKSPGLKEISFKALLPRKAYPFSSKIVLDPSVYLKGLELLKTQKITSLAVCFFPFTHLPFLKIQLKNLILKAKLKGCF